MPRIYKVILNTPDKEQRAADELTAARVRAILSDPKTPEGVQ